MNILTSCYCTCTREPLLHPFGFKGGALTELWQITCHLSDDEGHTAVGLGVQSVLWSDAAIFAELGQEKGNRLMYSMTEYALTLLKGRELNRPDIILEELIPEVLEYGRKESGFTDMRLTFVLNALTPVDWALWKLYAKTTTCPHLTKLAAPITEGLWAKQPILANIPLLTYGTGADEIKFLAHQGTFLYKIKIGSAPNGPADLDAMLEWDCNRLLEIHQLIKDEVTPYTECGHPVYYLDANGRYDTVERLKRLLNFADKHDILERIILLEEPFAEDNLQNVSNLPVLVVGDESAHSAEDALMLIEEYGYSAMALKPIAKTLSVTLRVLDVALKHNVPCFCADLTVNPTMTEYNKAVASRLSLLPGLKCGVVESNGAQNYTNWNQMLQKDPAFGQPWQLPTNGIYQLDEKFFETDGGIWL